MDARSLFERLGAFTTAFSQRFAELFVGLIALGVGTLFFYSGARGLLGYATGVRAPWTEPWVCLLGLVAGTWMLLMSIRLFRGPGPHRNMLLSETELAVLSLGVTAGSLWTMTFAPPKQALAFLVVGLAGLGRWWVLRRSRRASPREPPP
jgi:hypothetical protein